MTGTHPRERPRIDLTACAAPSTSCSVSRPAMSNRELVRDVVEPLPIVNAANGEPPPRLTPRAEKLLNRGSVRDHWKLVAVRREEWTVYTEPFVKLYLREGP